MEVYAESGRVHAVVAAICELLARHGAIAISDIAPYLYVHYGDQAVRHLLSMTCGLESKLVGESQILGQVRRSLALARRHGTLSRALEDLGALALHTAKRAHAETRIDRAGANLVSAGAGLAAALLSPSPIIDHARPLSGLSVLVVSAGSMSSLAAATAARLGAAGIIVANRTRDRAERLAASAGGSTADLSALPAAIGVADLVISCTGAAEVVITTEMVADALRLRAPAGSRDRPLALPDLAMPRDVDAAAGHLPGVRVLDLGSLHGAGATLASAQAQDVAAVRAIVAQELAARVAARHAARVAPTVVGLRTKAAGVVEAELARLGSKLGDLDDQAHADIARAMHRVAGKLLHPPTVRVKELAGSADGDSYETALRVLFDLGPGRPAITGWPRNSSSRNPASSSVTMAR